MYIDNRIIAQGHACSLLVVQKCWCILMWHWVLCLCSGFRVGGQRFRLLHHSLCGHSAGHRLLPRSAQNGMMYNHQSHLCFISTNQNHCFGPSQNELRIMFPCLHTEIWNVLFCRSFSSITLRATGLDPALMRKTKWIYWNQVISSVIVIIVIKYFIPIFF